MKNSKWDKENSLSRSRERKEYNHVSPSLQQRNSVLSDNRVVNDRMLSRINEASNEDLKSQSQYHDHQPAVRHQQSRNANFSNLESFIDTESEYRKHNNGRGASADSRSEPMSIKSHRRYQTEHLSPPVIKSTQKSPEKHQEKYQHIKDHMKRIVQKYKSGNRFNSQEPSARNIYDEQPSYRFGITEVREVQAIDEDTMKSSKSISIQDVLKQQPVYERKRYSQLNDRKSAQELSQQWQLQCSKFDSAKRFEPLGKRNNSCMVLNTVDHQKHDLDRPKRFNIDETKYNRAQELLEKVKKQRESLQSIHKQSLQDECYNGSDSRKNIEYNPLVQLNTPHHSNNAQSRLPQTTNLSSQQSTWRHQQYKLNQNNNSFDTRTSENILGYKLYDRFEHMENSRLNTENRSTPVNVSKVVRQNQIESTKTEETNKSFQICENKSTLYEDLCKYKANLTVAQNHRDNIQRELVEVQEFVEKFAEQMQEIWQKLPGTTQEETNHENYQNLSLKERLLKVQYDSKQSSLEVTKWIDQKFEKNHETADVQEQLKERIDRIQKELDMRDARDQDKDQLLVKQQNTIEELYAKLEMKNQQLLESSQRSEIASVKSSVKDNLVFDQQCQTVQLKNSQIACQTDFAESGGDPPQLGAIKDIIQTQIEEITKLKIDNSKLQEQNASMKKYEKYYNKLRARKYRNTGCQVTQMEFAAPISNFTSDYKSQRDYKSYQTGESYVKRIPKQAAAGASGNYNTVQSSQVKTPYVYNEYVIVKNTENIKAQFNKSNSSGVTTSSCKQILEDRMNSHMQIDLDYSRIDKVRQTENSFQIDEQLQKINSQYGSASMSQLN